jgi:hypothetical protein
MQKDEQIHLHIYRNKSINELLHKIEIIIHTFANLISQGLTIIQRLAV